MAARQVLVVDDEVGIRELLNDILQDEGYRVHVAENAAQARAIRNQARPDVVLLDIWMPDCDGITLLKEWGNNGLLTMPVVMMSGHGTIDTAVEATRIGAFDFLEKPIALQKLLKTVSDALKFGETVPHHEVHLFNLGKSYIINELRKRLEQVAALKTPLLLIGAEGSGAELCARFVHTPGTPWFTLTETKALVETPNEILKAQAEGCIFVPEVGKLNKPEQKGLAVLIQNAAKYAVRVICATAMPLPQLLESGSFDTGLYQLLSTTSLSIPSLDAHKEDVPDLVNAIVIRLSEVGEANYREFDTAALNALRNMNWPGNLSQLENVVRNLLQTSLGEHITLDDVNRVISQYNIFAPALPNGAEPATRNNIYIDLDQPLRGARDEFERIYLEYQIEKANGNISKVAETVELERTHLYRKLKQLNMKIK